MRTLAIFTALTMVVARAASADIVNVEVTGEVNFNVVADAPLSGVGVGESATLIFQVDSNNFVEGVPGDTRGYVIDQASFSLSFSGGTVVALADPFPAGQTPYFSLVEGFPVSDGFFVSTSPNSPGGVPLNVSDHNLNVDLGYEGDTLTTLDILDAFGVYDFGGLTRFGFNVWRVFPDNIGLDITFSQMTISGAAVPVEAVSWGGVKSTFR